ncbi:hypothetical protein AMAG_18921 [Allomyces macrogynus ATCC 38327]|uniref:histidine kinase n=1 Tax=Allomyces macrogynus (strain ATCC 38327) TaxID=578462 RepID=A0A0L0SK67_ALLM3|nr:hypothetical protein AMAG_18921 [Allomyces macrogynus ATCC 38327]|eukprot:KNE62814.1 hypothetical protein AMAG_18921 [Allomyces macrogynus ATCC 38327]
MSVLEREKQEAEALNSTKTVFLATVSHELRTPMNAIIGLVDLLLTKYTLSRDMREVLEIVAVSSSTLLNLVNDLLDLSKLECQGSGFTLDHRPFSVLDVVEKSIEVVCTQAEAKGLYLCAHLDHEFNVVVGDKLRLRQVLVNLMSNAIKFTERDRRSGLTAGDLIRFGSGTTHLLKVWTTSDTATLALTKAVTAIVSVVTSVALVQLMPMAMLLPGRLFLLEEELVVRAHNERVLQAENTNLTKLRAITLCVRRALEFHTICDIASVQLARHFDLVGCAVFALDAHCPVPDAPATPAAMAAALASGLRSAPPSPAVSHCAWPCSPVPGHVPLADMSATAPDTHPWAQHFELGPATCVALHHTPAYADLVAAAAASPRMSSSSRGSSSRTSTGSAPTTHSRMDSVHAAAKQY